MSQELNLKKCGALKLRIDRRTNLPVVREVLGIPILESYKYLGVHIDDCLKMDQERTHFESSSLERKKKGKHLGRLIKKMKKNHHKY